MAAIRKAATLLVANKTSKLQYNSWNVTPRENFNLLFLTRSSKTKFMPNAVVFPGGAFDALADSSPNWWKILDSGGYSERNLMQQFSYPRSELRPSIYSNMDPSSKDSPILPPEISLRLCALRETFEETGLLLGFDGKKGIPVVLTDAKEIVKGKTIAEWRDEVTGDPNKFSELFKSMSPIMPWLEGLVEWWGWLTPLFLKSRFDTIFYTVCINQDILPDSLSCCSESDKLQLIPPSLMIQSWHESNCILAPPQIYELGRLANYTALADFDNAVEKRVIENGSRCAPAEIWAPQLYGANDGAITVLPGDVLYNHSYPFPQFADQQDGVLRVFSNKRPKFDLTINELREWVPSVSPSHDGLLKHFRDSLESGSVTYNRGELHKEGKANLVVSPVERSGQVVPLDIGTAGY